MKILWFTWKDCDNPLAGGAEVVNEELAKRLAARGHQVTFLVGGYGGGPETGSRYGFKIIRVGNRLTSYLAAAHYFRQHRAELAPDLVIDECNTIPYFAGWYTGVPTVLFFHMLCRKIWFYELPPALGIFGYLAEPLYLRALKRSPVFTISESTSQDLQRQGFAASSITVIPQGSNTKPVPNLRDIKKTTLPTLLSLGAMRSMKRTLHQIRCFELAKAKIPNLRLAIAGDSSGAYGQKVLQTIARSPYAVDIHYHGRVSPAEKLQLMRTSHLLLVTAVKEGWGLTVTEAASQGTPAVAYNADGLRDSIRDGQTGLLTSTNTPQALAKAVVALLNNPKRYTRLRQLGWEWSRTFTFDRSYAAFEQALGLNDRAG